MTFCRLSKETSLLAMTGMTTSFFVVEIVYGYVSNSMALVADSFHMLSDIIALIVAYVAVRVSPKDWSKNTFGYARAEVLGALVNAVFLMALCFTILVEAVKRFVIVEPITNPMIVFIVGAIGLFVNLVGLLLFHDGHGHSHDKGEHDGSQMNIKGVFLHIVADALGSVIVMISASVVWFTDWKYENYVDPALSLVLVFLILASTWPLFKDSAMILLQTVPSHLKVQNIEEKIIEEIPEVAEVHEFHIWNLVGSRIVASLHVTLNRQMDNYMDISRRIKGFFHRQGIHSTTIQLEYARSLLLRGFGEEGEDDRVSRGSGDRFIAILSPSTFENGHKSNSCTLMCPIDDDSNVAISDSGPGGGTNCESATCCGPRVAQNLAKKKSESTTISIQSENEGNKSESNSLESTSL